MAKIIAPNENYMGISAGIPFANGVGYTDDKDLLKWFRSHGYTVEEEAQLRRNKTKDSGEEGS